MFAVLRWRHQEKQKAIEASQWAEQRRNRAGVTNPLYDIPMEGGDSVTVIQDPYRVATSGNVGLYDVVEPVSNGTYGNVGLVDGYGKVGYLEVGGAEDPPVLDAHETAAYDKLFAIPTEDGSSVVAYEASGAQNNGYLVVNGEGPYATSGEPTYDGDTQYMEVVGDNTGQDPETFAGFSKSGQSEPTRPSGEDNRAEYAQAGVVYDIAVDAGDTTGYNTVVQTEVASPYKLAKDFSSDLTSTL